MLSLRIGLLSTLLFKQTEKLRSQRDVYNGIDFAPTAHFERAAALRQNPCRFSPDKVTHGKTR
jgi:hypothetical protein